MFVRLACTASGSSPPGFHPADRERTATITPILQAFYRVDSLSNLFAIATVLLFVVTPVALGSYPARPRGFWRAVFLVLLGAGGLLSLVYTSNLLLLYLSWETIGVLSLPAWPDMSSSRRWSKLKNWLAFNLAGYPLLAGILLLQTRAGTFDYTSPAITPAFSVAIFLLFFLTIAARLVLPLSRLGQNRSIVPVAVIREVLVYSLPGAYLLTRMYSLGRWDVNWNLLVVSFGAGILVGAVVLMLVARDPFATLSRFALGQVAFLVVAVGLGSALAVAAGLLYLVTFALAFSALLTGLGETPLPERGSILQASPAPLPARTFAPALAGLVMAGLPFLGSFACQWLFYNAALESGYPVLAVVGGPATLSLGLLLFRADKWTWGQNSLPTAKGESWGWLVISPIVVVVLLVFGAAPQLPLTYLIKPAIAALAPGLTELRVVEIRPWLGLEVSRGNGLWGLWFPTPSLVVFILALIVGYIIYRLGRPSGKPVDAFAGGDAPS